jgi:hypothetical protein
MPEKSWLVAAAGAANVMAGKPADNDSSSSSNLRRILELNDALVFMGNLFAVLTAAVEGEQAHSAESSEKGQG